MEMIGDTGIYDDGGEASSSSLRRRKEKCPDCLKCQLCSESRCGLCKKGGHRKNNSGLGTAFTYGQYVEWKKQRESGQ